MACKNFGLYSIHFDESSAILVLFCSFVTVQYAYLIITTWSVGTRPLSAAGVHVIGHQ